MTEHCIFGVWPGLRQGWQKAIDGWPHVIHR